MKELKELMLLLQVCNTETGGQAMRSACCLPAIFMCMSLLKRRRTIDEYSQSL